AIADDELHLILGSQALQLLVAITPLLSRRWRLDVDDQNHARIESLQGHRAARFEGHSKACVTDCTQQLRAALLCQGLAARHADIACAGLSHPFEDCLHLPPLAAMESVCSVAVLAPQRATGEPNEDRRDADAIGFTL